MTDDRPRPLVRVLNSAFGLELADFAEARAWLNDGGWDRLDEWLAAHRGDDNDNEEAQ